MLPLERKTKALYRIYEIYEEFTATLQTACEKYCATCCTCNVTLTTLEAYQITNHLNTIGKPNFFHHRKRLSGQQNRFHPRITTNQLAQLSLAGKDIPIEKCDPSWGKCPFLDNAACPIYSVRPFGCRCLLSAKKCRALGYAEIPPFVLTVNTVFMQLIEHVDQEGLSGNLIDVTGWLTEGENSKRYESGMPLSTQSGLIKNQPMQILMVPEEHRGKLKDILAALQHIRV